MRKLNWQYIEDKLYDLTKNQSRVDEMIPKLKDIDRVRSEKNAVILAHYYQIPPIQLIADHRGDSLKLAMVAKEIGDKDLVVSSTVHFMAEMVKLLSPDKKVVIPNPDASCSIAEGMNGATIRRLRKVYPGAAVVGYINTTAEVKAELDTTCTSANAKEIIERIGGDPVIMLPDHYFAENVFKSLDSSRNYLAYRRIEGKNIVLYNPRKYEEVRIPLDGTDAPLLDKGICVVHEQFTPEHVAFYRGQRNIDLVLAHPEVRPDVADIADVVGGTGKMLDIIGQTDAQRILYLTECDLVAPLLEAYPDREFVTPCTLCSYMKKNTLDGLMDALQNETHEVTVDPRIAGKAKQAIERMFELT